MPWIKKARPAFNWDTDKISFTKRLLVNQNLILHSKQKNKWIVSALYLPNSFKDAADSKLPDIVFVGQKKFHSICPAKNTQAWIMKWSDLLNSDDNRAAGLMVKAIIEENLGPSQVVLPKKYFDLLNMFDKA